MPFIVSTETLSRAWEDAQSLARQVSAVASDQKNSSIAGAVPGSFVLNFEAFLRSARDRFDQIAATAGIAAYVTALPNTPQGYNVATEFANMRTQIDATVNWIRNNFPKDANGYLAERKFNPGGYVEQGFTTAQLATYRAQLDALIASLG